MTLLKLLTTSIYRKTSDNIRGCYKIFPFFRAVITRGRTLLEAFNIFCQNKGSGHSKVVLRIDLLVIFVSNKNRLIDSTVRFTSMNPGLFEESILLIFSFLGKYLS